MLLAELSEIIGTHDNTLMLASGTVTGRLAGSVSVMIPRPFIGHRLNVNDHCRSRHVAFKPGHHEGKCIQFQGALCKFGLLEAKGGFVVT